MLKITQKIDEILKEKDISRYRLCKLIGFHEGAFSMILSGKRDFSENVLKKLLPILEVSKEEFSGWVITDKHPKVFIRKAAEAAKNRKYKTKKILAQNLNEMLKEKNLSETAFAKAVKYDQSSFNKMVKGQISMSPTVIKKTSEFFEIPEEDIRAWSLADKYGLGALEEALKYF